MHPRLSRTSNALDEGSLRNFDDARDYYTITIRTSLGGSFSPFLILEKDTVPVFQNETIISKSINKNKRKCTWESRRCSSDQQSSAFGTAISACRSHIETSPSHSPYNSALTSPSPYAASGKVVGQNGLQISFFKIFSFVKQKLIKLVQ